MAQLPNLEINLAIVDADELLREVKLLHEQTRKAQRMAMTAWFFAAVVGTMAATIFLLLGRTCS
jgi:uncharacterized membrane protein YozB (DUF420 family)